MWLDDYIEFSKYWSPKSYGDYHEALGIALLSGIAAKRVQFPFGGPNHTHLYVILAGHTSIYAKTTALKNLHQVLEVGDFRRRTLPDNVTPAKLVSIMASTLIEGVDADPEYIQADYERGQRIWVYDEFGTHLSHIMNPRGAYRDLLGMLRIFDDHIPEKPYVYATRSYDIEEIKDPYLTLVGCLTPADLARYAKWGSSLWSDGYLARMCFVCPPEGEPALKGEFPREEQKILPGDVLEPLIAWDERLTEEKDVLDVTHAVYESRKQYHDRLEEMIETNLLPTDLHGNLSKLPLRTFRIAALLASIDGTTGAINMTHWNRAQTVTEKWQAGVVSLYSQVAGVTTGRQEQKEEKSKKEKVLRKINRHPGITEAAIYSGSNSWIARPDLVDVLEELLDEDDIYVKSGRGGATKHYLKDYEA